MVIKMSEKWLILSYTPVSLFSLRMTHATSKGGKTLLLPTPYCFKMTLIDTCFRAFTGHDAVAKAHQVFDLVKDKEIRFSPPNDCIVQNTFIKIKQEDREAPSGLFNSTIAYREFCFYNNGELKVAIRIEELSQNKIDLLTVIGKHINCIGKRGSFWQYTGNFITSDPLTTDFTIPKESAQPQLNDYRWLQHLDDFGDDLCKAKDGFDRISTFGQGTIKLNQHRLLVQTLLPYRFERSSKHFTQYKKL
jgi:hypothetical protein